MNLHHYLIELVNQPFINSIYSSTEGYNEVFITRPHNNTGFQNIIQVVQYNNW